MTVAIAVGAGQRRRPAGAVDDPGPTMGLMTAIAVVAWALATTAALLLTSTIGVG